MRMGRLNLLEMSPVLKEGLKLEQKGEASVLVIPRNSWLERLSVRLWNQPAAFRVKLDALGSQVLRKCAGQHTVARLNASWLMYSVNKRSPSCPDW